MSEARLRASQLEMASYLRNPDVSPPPPGVEQRRLDIYKRLVYNNIEGFISGGFPVLRSLYEGEAWHALVRDFIDNHRCHTPYFLEISQEFIQFLLDQYQPRECDPPFLAELAHYEWVELALDVSEQALPEAVCVDDPLAAVPALSPLAWLLSYQFPVHRLGPGYQPAEAAEPTYLAVYRDATERVRFMELNAVTARLLELCRDNDGATGEALLRTLAAETGMEPAAMLEFGVDQLASLFASNVLFVAGSPRTGA
jgi:hypothetical protein